jgi:hypothetical protein
MSFARRAEGAVRGALRRAFARDRRSAPPLEYRAGGVPVGGGAGEGNEKAGYPLGSGLLVFARPSGNLGARVALQQSPILRDCEKTFSHQAARRYRNFLARKWQIGATSPPNHNFTQ